MLRSYNTASRKQFQFGYSINNSSSNSAPVLGNILYSSKITNQDVRILNKIEREINSLVSRNQSLGQEFIDTTHYNFLINLKLSLIVKNTLNQYDIGHFERTKWCGLRKYTLITFDKIIPRIISNSYRDVSPPLEKILSNAINIKTPKANANANANLITRHILN